MLMYCFPLFVGSLCPPGAVLAMHVRLLGTSLGCTLYQERNIIANKRDIPRFGGPWEVVSSTPTS